MSTAHYFLRSFFSSQFRISILTLALCFLPPGYGLWAWPLLLDGSALYSSYLLHTRYSHLWINWKTPEGSFLEGKPMPGAILNFSPYETGSCVQAQFTPLATEMAT